jgi:hypothetical protein
MTLMNISISIPYDDGETNGFFFKTQILYE